MTPDILRIASQKTNLETQIAAIEKRISDRASDKAAVDQVRTLLEQLRAKLDRPLAWETKRKVVEALVDHVSMTYDETSGDRRAEIVYRFQPHATRQYQAWKTADGSVKDDTPSRR